MTELVRKPALAIQGLSHRFDRVTALESISLEIEDGEILALLGPSGCGKSTLLRLIAGLEPIQAGQISIGGKVVSAAPRRDLPPEKREVGFLFQDYALFPHLSAADNVAFGLGHLDASARRKRAGEMMEQLDVAALAKAFPHTLSGGQQQRIALARALAPSPSMILLDEPLSSLDARLRRNLADTLLSVLREIGTTAVLVTHDPEEAMYVADRIGVMRDGRLEQFGDPNAIYARPENSFVADFLFDSNQLNGIVSADGTVDTGWGAVPANGLAPKEPVQVMIRYEGIGLGTNGAVSGKVLRSRVTGSVSLMVLEHAERPGEHLFARVPTAMAAREGDCVAVTLDSAHVFVFPAINAT